MICPKCGRAVPETNVICGACDYILDPSFLWEDGLQKKEGAADGPISNPAFAADSTQEIPSLSLLLGEGVQGQPSVYELDFEEQTPPDGVPLFAAAPGEEAEAEIAVVENWEAGQDAELESWLFEASFDQQELPGMSSERHEPHAERLAPAPHAPDSTWRNDAAEALSAHPLAAPERDESLQEWIFEPSREEDVRPHADEIEASDFHTDPVLLGNLEEDYEVFVAQDSNWFLTAATQDVERPVQSVPLYLSKSVREMLRPAAVLARVERCDAALTPFEEHILQFVDGQRPLGRVTVLSGLAQQDVEIAVSMMAEKHVVQLVGQATRKSAAEAPPEIATTAPPSSPPKPSPAPAAQGKDVFTDGDPARSSAAPPVSPPPTASKSGRATSQLRQRQVAQRLQQRNKIADSAAAAPAPPKTGGTVRKANSRIETELFERAKVEEEVGNYEQAVALLRRCIREQPHVAGFHNRLGVLLAARLKDYTNAIIHLTTATELQPDNPVYRNNLGKIIAAAAASDGSELSSKDAGKGGLWATLKRIF